MKTRWLYAWTALAAALCAAATFHPETESDSFWHMMLGRAVLAAHARVVPEPTALPSFTHAAVCPEWLWEVLLYGLFRAGGWVALVLLVAAIGVAIVFLSVRLVGEVAPDAGGGAVAWISGFVVSCAMARMRTRPETPATALLLATLVLTSLYLGASSTRRRWLFGAAIVATDLVWAQIHGSFVLAPALFVILVGPALAREARPEVRTTHLATLAGLVFTLLSTAYGLDLFAYLAAHAGGDATRHVSDMQATSFMTLDPMNVASTPHGPLILCLGASGVAGMLLARELWGREIALAVLGGALAFDAVRFLAIAPIFFVPLAARGAVVVARALAGGAETGRARRLVVRALPALGAVVGLAAIVNTAHLVDERFGPLGHVGPAEEVHPLAAAAYLAAAPAGANVLSTYNAGGALGYLLDGHARTYVDARTPLYFDDVAFGVSRDVFTRPAALAIAAERFDAAAIVVSRDARVCASVPPGYVPVVVEAHLSTFARGGDALKAVTPCGADYIAASACGDVAGFDREIERLTSLRDSAFVRYLRAERILRCGGSIDDVPSLLPARRLARGFVEQRDAAEASYLLRAGNIQGAVRVAEASVADGYIAAASVVAPVLESGVVAPARARRVLEPIMRRMDDDAPPPLRAVLAGVCAAERDVRCARLQATRAAAAGVRSVAPVLAWLRDNAPDDEQREDARAWLDALRRQPPPAARGAAPSPSLPEPLAEPTTTTRPPPVAP
jgi:hypothetical protein